MGSIGELFSGILQLGAWFLIELLQLVYIMFHSLQARAQYSVLIGYHATGLDKMGYKRMK